jgi:predicted MFS family arabinose efflux permease
LNVSETELGYLFTAFFLTSAFSKIVVGFFVKQRYLAVLYTLGTFLISLSIFLYVLSPNLWFLILFRTSHGIGFAISNVACLTVASLIVKEEQQSSSISLVSTFAALGLIVGPLLGTFGTLFFDIPFTFELVSIITLVSFALSLYTVRDKELRIRYQGQRDQSPKRSLTFLKEEWFLLNVAAYFAYALIYGTLIAYFPLYAVQLFGFKNYDITTLFFIFFVFALLSRLILTKKNDTKFLKKMLVISIGISITMLAFISVVSILPLFVLAFTFIGFGHGFVYPITALFISKNSNTQQRLTVNTLYYTSFDLGNALGPILASMMFSFLPLNLVFFGSAILPAILLIVIATNITHIILNTAS